MTKTVLYFTANNVPTVDELADIAKLNGKGVPEYQTTVMNGKANGQYGDGRPVLADYVAGTVPAQYRAGGVIGGNPIYPVIDPDEIPQTDLLPTQVIVNDGDTLEEAGGGTIAVAVEDGVATYTYTAPVG